MIIHAGEFLLRSITLNDTTAFYHIVNDEKVKQYVPNAYSRNLQETLENIKIYTKGDCINDFYLVIEKQKTLIGAIIAVKTESSTLDVSTIIAKPYRGKGIMTKMLNAFIQWLINNTEYTTLCFSIKKDNIPSNRQVLKCGAILKEENDNTNFYEVSL